MAFVGDPTVGPPPANWAAVARGGYRSMGAPYMPNPRPRPYMPNPRPRAPRRPPVHAITPPQQIAAVQAPSGSPYDVGLQRMPITQLPVQRAMPKPVLPPGGGIYDPGSIRRQPVLPPRGGAIYDPGRIRRQPGDMMAALQQAVAEALAGGGRRPVY